MRKQFALFIASLSVAAPAQALNMYQQYYVPALTVDADHPAELTVLPETYIVNSSVNSYDAVLFPYFVHRMSGSEGVETLNINPASNMNLKIIQKGDSFDPAKDCRLVLDISEMKLIDKKYADAIRAAQGMTNISAEVISVSVLEQVVIAIQNNLEATRQEYPNATHTIKSCSFAVEGLDKKPEIKKLIDASSPLNKTKL